MPENNKECLPAYFSHTLHQCVKQRSHTRGINPFLKSWLLHLQHQNSMYRHVSDFKFSIVQYKSTSKFCILISNYCINSGVVQKRQQHHMTLLLFTIFVIVKCSLAQPHPSLVEEGSDDSSRQPVNHLIRWCGGRNHDNTRRRLFCGTNKFFP